MKILVYIFGLLVLSVNAFAQNAVDSFDYEKKQNYSIQVVHSQDVDSTVTFEKIVIEGYDSLFPFYRYLNQKNSDGQYVILLHGLGSSKEDWVYPSMPYLQWTKNLIRIKDSLLTLGFNIIIPDAKYHGERSHELNFRPADQLPPVRSQAQDDGKIFSTLMLSTIKDIRIIMDFIESEWNVISKPAFSLVGYSMGGAIAILLNASEDRIKSVVACVPPFNRPEKEAVNLNWPKKIVHDLATVTPQNYSYLQKSPLLLLVGKRDWAYTTEEVTSFYEDVSIQEKEVKYFDSGHELPNDYVHDVIRWITTYNKE